MIFNKLMLAKAKIVRIMETEIRSSGIVKPLLMDRLLEQEIIAIIYNTLI